MEEPFPLCVNPFVRLLGCFLTVAVLAGCTIAQTGTPEFRPVAGAAAPKAGESGQGPDGRLARFQQLVALLPAGDSPSVEDVSVPASDDHAAPVHVIHILFNDGVVFDFDQDEPRQDVGPAIAAIARNVVLDKNNIAVTILGHTDAVGSDAYNMDLSQRRAINVMSNLISEGVAPTQLSTVAIGKRQPIAPNSTEDGRAKNRRVEFLISDSRAANLELVRQRVTPAEYLRAQGGGPMALAGAADVFVPVILRSPDGATRVILQPAGQVSLAPVAIEQVSPAAGPARVIPAKPRQRQRPVFETPAPVQLAPLVGPRKSY